MLTFQKVSEKMNGKMLGIPNNQIVAVLLSSFIGQEQSIPPRVTVDAFLPGFFVPQLQ